MAYILLFCSVISVMTGVMAAETSYTYRLNESTEYMDKTYVFTLVDQQVGTEVSAFCAEYSAPTFDTKRGLIDWVDYRAYGLEEIYEAETAGRIRAIMSTAGPHLEALEVISYFENRLGIMDVTYEEVVSAVQYAVWYFTDELMIVPSSENGYDMYKHLISLPPTSSVQATDLIRYTPVHMTAVSSGKIIEIVFQYDVSGYSGANARHSFTKDIEMLYGAKVDVDKSDAGLTTVTLQIPLDSPDEHFDFDVIIEGSRPMSGDVYAFSPDVRGEVQSMVGYTRRNSTVGLDTKSYNYTYTTYGLTIENDGKTVTNGFHSGSYVSISDIENLNPSGKIKHSFDGWFYKSGSKVESVGVVMDGPKHVVAEYSSIGSTDPDGGDQPDSGDTDIIADDDIPEGIIDNPFDPNPDHPADPNNGPNEPVIIEDPGIPQVSPEVMEPPYGPDGFDGEGDFFYYISRFVDSGGVPFVIFFLLGILALLIGMYLRQQEEREMEQAVEAAGPVVMTGMINRQEDDQELYHENPFHGEEEI